MPANERDAASGLLLVSGRIALPPLRRKLASPTVVEILGQDLRQLHEILVEGHSRGVDRFGHTEAPLIPHRQVGLQVVPGGGPTTTHGRAARAAPPGAGGSRPRVLSIYCSEDLGPAARGPGDLAGHPGRRVVSCVVTGRAAGRTRSGRIPRLGTHLSVYQRTSSGGLDSPPRTRLCEL